MVIFPNVSFLPLKIHLSFLWRLLTLTVGSLVLSGLYNKNLFGSERQAISHPTVHAAVSCIL